MHECIISRLEVDLLLRGLENMPAVALIGPRQCGKSTLARSLLANREGALILDLERPGDRRILDDPEAFFDANSEKLICLDEIQRMPELFPFFRYILDKRNRPGQLLLLGSASRDVIEFAAESLAGRIRYLELTPFLWSEIRHLNDMRTYWLRGGFPRSLLASSDEESAEWRMDFVRSFLERDVPGFNTRISPVTIERIWVMLAHMHGQLLNKAALAHALGVDGHSVNNYLDLLEGAFMIRRLPPYYSNTKKRLVKSPKVYIRDVGILHSLLQISSSHDLFRHSVYGFSWEGLVIENIIGRLKPGVSAFFYRTAQRAEADLLLEQGAKRIVIEIKASSAPKVERGFWNVLDDIQPDHAFVVSPVERRYFLKRDVEVVSLEEIIEEGLAEGWLR